MNNKGMTIIEVIAIMLLIFCVAGSLVCITGTSILTEPPKGQTHECNCIKLEK